MLIKFFSMMGTFTFAGLVIGTIPKLFKNANKSGFKKMYIFCFGTALIATYYFVLMKSQINITQMPEKITLDAVNILYLSAIGFILAGTAVIPGVSGSVVLMIMGAYKIVLFSIASLDIITLAPIFLGMGIGVIVFSKFMDFLLSKFYGFTYYIILGFAIGTIPEFLKGFSFDLTGAFCIIFLLSGTIISFLISFKES